MARAIIDAKTGKALKHGDDDELVDVRVIGKFFRRERQNPQQKEEDAPLVRYTKGAILKVSKRTLRESKGVLVAVADERTKAAKEGLYGLTDVSGIGRAQAVKLEADGIPHLFALAEAPAEKVARTVGTSIGTAQKWIAEAKELLALYEAEESGRSHTRTLGTEAPAPVKSIKVTAESSRLVQGTEGAPKADPNKATISPS